MTIAEVAKKHVTAEKEIDKWIDFYNKFNYISYIILYNNI